MANSISFRNAVAVVAIAITAELYFNRGQTIRSIVSSIFGNSANAQANSLKYRVIANSFHYYQNEDESLKKALVRARTNFPEEFQKVIVKENLSSEGDIFKFFKDKLSKGLCSGVANTLFDKIHRKESRSLKESVPLLNFEEIFYHQILEHICTHKKDLDFVARCELHLKKSEQNEKNLLIFSKCLSTKSLPTGIERKSDEEWAEVEKQIRAQLEKDLIHVAKDHHSGTFAESDEFLIEAGTPTYQNAFEAITVQFPDQTDFAGCLHILNHVISFQYGKSGYYLYDSFAPNKGLFEYPDSETFFKELKRHALEDVIHVKGKNISEENPNLESSEFTATVKKRLKKAIAYFGARPLNKINS